MNNVAMENLSAEVRYDWAARFYDTFNFFIERFASRRRKQILRRAKGNILEVGVGTGSSLRDYPASRQIVAVDISKEMLRKLPFKDETFDTIFSSLVFCSVTEPVRGLIEVRRVLKKEGQLLMLEHVKSENKALGYLMDKSNPLATRIGVGDINKDTLTNLREAGFKIKDERNLAYDVVKAIVAIRRI